MSETAGRLTEELLLEDVQSGAFAPSNGPSRIGLEVEQLAFQGSQAVPLAQILAALDPLVARGELNDITADGKPPTLAYGPISLTFEPGAQLEIVSPPRESAAQALRDVQQLETLLDGAFTWQGIRRGNHGMTPWQGVDEISLQTPLPRYQAMHDYFAQIGPDGARMMRLSCALQINIDSGPADASMRRWRLANLMSPVLIGMFANSPMAEGHVTGWKSTRAQVVAAMDPSRTGPILGEDGPSAYLQFALDAGVLLRRAPGGYRVGSPDVTFRDWLHDGVAASSPTLDDWHYHLTTLWPMVRPRGFLELRAIDTAPVRWRAVPVALASALLLDVNATRAALECLEPQAHAMSSLADRSARDGVSDPVVGRLCADLMEIGQEAIRRMPAGWLDADSIDDLRAFDEQYTRRGRCPADDLLDLHGPELDAARAPAAAAEEAE